MVAPNQRPAVGAGTRWREGRIIASGVWAAYAGWRVDVVSVLRGVALGAAEEVLWVADGAVAGGWGGRSGCAW